MQRNGNDFYYHCDDLHSVMAVTDSNAAVVERYDYGDYGQPLDGAGVPLVRSAIGSPYLFTGRRYDDETGWYYYRTRYLDPAVGRFTTRDTLGNWGAQGNHGNGYDYVGANPFTRVDPSGQKGHPASQAIEQHHENMEKSLVAAEAALRKRVDAIAAKNPKRGSALFQKFKKLGAQMGLINRIRLANRTPAMEMKMMRKAQAAAEAPESNMNCNKDARTLKYHLDVLNLQHWDFAHWRWPNGGPGPFPTGHTAVVVWPKGKSPASGIILDNWWASRVTCAKKSSYPGGWPFRGSNWVKGKYVAVSAPSPTTNPNTGNGTKGGSAKPPAAGAGQTKKAGKDNAQSLIQP